MSEYTVCRTLDTHPALRYCLLLDDMRIAGGKPDYRGDNILISWRTKETYGPVDALSNENAKLRKLLLDVHAIGWSGFDCTECPVSFSGRCEDNGGCKWLGILADRMRELGIEVGE